MRILQISGATPTDTGDGRTATFATLRAICRAGHQITYAYPCPGASPADSAFARQMLQACQGNLGLLPLPVRLHRFEKLLRGCRAIAIGSALLGGRVCRELLTGPRETVDKCRRLSCSLHRFRGGVVRKLTARLARDGYDVVQVDFPWMVSIGSRLPHRPPKLFVAYELQTEIVQQAYPDDRRLYQAVADCEARQLRHYDAVAALSPENAELLRDGLGIPRVYCSPLGVDCSRWCPPSTGPEAGGEVRFTFLGGHAHRPNVDAVEWLCGEIVPELRLALPRLKLQIIGDYPKAFRKALAAEEISFLGYVKDLDQLIPGSIFLCPVRWGSGMRIKIIDAIMRGAAVVSTTVGALGLGLEAGKHYLQADSPGQFARQAMRLVRSDSFRRAICTAARQRVAATLSAEATALRRIAVIEDVIQTRRSWYARYERKAA